LRLSLFSSSIDFFSFHVSPLFVSHSCPVFAVLVFVWFVQIDLNLLDLICNLRSGLEEKGIATTEVRLAGDAVASVMCGACRDVKVGARKEK
jgi:hypothetical protein